MVETAKFLGASDSDARREMLEVLNFEKELAEISTNTKNYKQRNVDFYKKFKLNQLTSGNSWPDSWKTFVQNMLPGVDIKNNENIIISGKYKFEITFHKKNIGHYTVNIFGSKIIGHDCFFKTFCTI